MGRAVGDPDEDLGDVLGDEGMGSFVGFFCAGGVAFEANQRELGFGKARVDGADADSGAVEFEAKGAGDLKLAGFGGAIGSASFVNHARGVGADVDNGAATIVR